MSHEPLVSVIMPAYNAAAFIRAAIASALAQTYSNLEVLVVDDGSTDATPHIVAEIAQQDARVKLLQQPNGGVAHARNFAIEHARGEFIAPLDADDLWMPTKIASQVAAMQEGGPEVGLVYTWWLAIDEAGAIVDAGAQWDVAGRVLEALIYCNFIGNASVPLFRRDALKQVGYYDPQLRAQNAQGCEDWDITLRVAERYEIHCVLAYLSCYRNVSGSMAKNCDTMAKSHELVIQALYDRHPHLPVEVSRWSRGLLLLWLTGLSYHEGNYRDSLRLSLRLLRTDPAAIFSLWVLQTLFRSALWLLFGPFTLRLWPDRKQYAFWKRDWRVRIKRAPYGRHVGMSSDATDFSSLALSPAELGSTPVLPKHSKPFAWSPRWWLQYDRICLRRWKSLTKPSSPYA
jgi:glycosyltransferase involved in cell wall biosynthesis